MTLGLPQSAIIWKDTASFRLQNYWSCNSYVIHILDSNSLIVTLLNICFLWKHVTDIRQNLSLRDMTVEPLRCMLSRCHFLHIIRKFYYYMLVKMVVLTRKQLEKPSKEELIDELPTVNSIHEELANLTSIFHKFLEKYARVESEIEISKNCTKPLSKQI